jgi:hypothetical protein
MPTPLWPLDVLPPRNPSFDLAPRSLSGPASISGHVQVAASDAGIWTATYDAVPVVNDQKVKAWRAIDMLLEGRLFPILVPFSRLYQPVPAGAVEAGLYDAIPHADDAFFNDDTGYVGRVIDVTLAGSIATRSVAASVVIHNAARLEPAQHFSIEERLYRLRTVVYTSETTADITFRPPLREAASLGAQLEFDDPVCRMKLASDGEMKLPLEYARWGFPTVNFVEDV